jgi:hypothetical protein
MFLAGGIAQAQAQNSNQREREDVSAERQLVEQLGGVTTTSTAAAPINPFNRAVLEQVGSGNTGQIVQQGSGLSTTIVQNGSGNTAVSNVTGQGTTSNILQQGNGNTVEQELRNKGQRQFVVEQLGNSNVLKQQETGQGGNLPNGYGVQMVGNGIKMEIRQGAIGTLP